MSTISEPMATVESIPRARIRALVVPREHGAWGMLLIPLITGAWIGLLAGNRILPLILLIVTALTLFWLRTPLESWLGTTPMRAQTPAERHAAGTVVMTLAAIAAACLIVLFRGGAGRGLTTIGAVAAIAFIAQALVKRLGRGGRMPSQLIGSIGLTATAPAAYYVVTGHFDSRAVMLWALNFLFAGDQIHFVQVRIHAARAAGFREKLARGRSFFPGQFAMALALAVACYFGLLPILALIAFVPVLLRGVLWFFSGPQPLDVHRLGWTEMAHALTFGALLILAFYL